MEESNMKWFNRSSQKKLSMVMVLCFGLLVFALPREASAQCSAAWFVESFNNCNSFIGNVPADGFGFGRSLNLSPSPESGITVSGLADVPDQYSGLQLLEFDV